MNKLTYIDDCQLDQFILKKVLSRYGTSYQVNCTDTCIGVLSLLSQSRLDKHAMPDIILLDIYMPGVNVWDFLDRIKWLYPTFPKPVEVYILSACRHAADVERAKKYWFVKEFMLKPVTKEMIQHLIRKKEGQLSRFSILETAC